MAKWMKLHNKIYSHLFNVLSVSRIHPHVLVEDHRDKGDHAVTIQQKGKECKRIIEVEHLVKMNNKFRFKHHKMIRCSNNKMPILYVHHSASSEPKLRCFSVNEINDMLQTMQPLQVQQIFGGKAFYELKESSYTDWVAFNTLLPFENYIVHMRKLFKSKS